MPAKKATKTADVYTGTYEGEFQLDFSWQRRVYIPGAWGMSQPAREMCGSGIRQEQAR